MITDRDVLNQALMRGMDMARDPLNARITAPDESRTTTIYSPWLLQICRVCHHTFREDDLVRPDPLRAGRMLHEDQRYGLFCWSHVHQRTPDVSPSIADYCSPDVREAFLRGLHAHWQPAGDTKGVLVEQGSPGFKWLGLKCPVCRHTVRLGDYVVPCPCGNECGGVFHQDVTRHLTCWDTWNRSRYEKNYCAFTGALFKTTEGSERA